MTFWLRDLGSQYKVEKTEDWDCCEGNEKSYGEMIRVRGSRPEPPYFMVPSHLYKYSETELGLYLKERKNLWRPLGRILNQNIDVHDTEIMIHFPIAKLADVAQIVPFVRKRGQRDLTESEKRDRRQRLGIHVRTSRKIEKNEPKAGGKNMEGVFIVPAFHFRKQWAKQCQYQAAGFRSHGKRSRTFPPLASLPIRVM
jgi:hypothetical protein